jgi:hypothetical protein
MQVLRFDDKMDARSRLPCQGSALSVIVDGRSCWGVETFDRTVSKGHAVAGLHGGHEEAMLGYTC